MKRVLLLVTVILISAQSFSQETQPQTNSQLSANLFLPSLEWEIKTGQNSTVDINLGVGIAYRRSFSQSEFGILPAIQSSYRYYYNLKKRLEKGKKVSENSGNYVAAIATIQSGNPIIGEYNLVNDYSVLIGPTWGLQRTYNSGFKLNLNLGAGYGFNDAGGAAIRPFASIQLGWLLVKGKG